MIAEIGLSILVLALTALLAWEKHQNRQERAKFINALVSKSANEMTNLEMADKTKIKVERGNNNEVKDERPNLVPLDNLDDEAFLKAIKLPTEGQEDASGQS